MTGRIERKSMSKKLVMGVVMSWVILMGVICWLSNQLVASAERNLDTLRTAAELGIEKQRAERDLEWFKSLVVEVRIKRPSTEIPNPLRAPTAEDEFAAAQSTVDKAEKDLRAAETGLTGLEKMSVELKKLPTSLPGGL